MGEVNVGRTNQWLLLGFPTRSLALLNTAFLRAIANFRGKCQETDFQPFQRMSDPRGFLRDSAIPRNVCAS